jgi:hypothetical protein
MSCQFRFRKCAPRGCESSSGPLPITLTFVSKAGTIRALLINPDESNDYAHVRTAWIDQVARHSVNAQAGDAQVLANAGLGKFSSGVRDLGSKKKHLRGFGY